MEGYIGYTRVSTVKQGTKGVSLQEQRDGISRYGERNQLPITVWLEEMETAAKQGRPVFNQALKLLRTGKARASFSTNWIAARGTSKTGRPLASFRTRASKSIL